MRTGSSGENKRPGLPQGVIPWWMYLGILFGMLIDEEVRRIVEEQYTRAQGLIRSHRPQLEQLAALLLEKEVAYKEDLEKILGGRRGKSELSETMMKANIAAS